MKPILDEVKRQQICAILGVGGTRQMAAGFLGCHVDTIRNTAKRDPNFGKQLRRAEATPEITYLKSIQTAAADSKQWRAAAWALERLYPARYAPRKAEMLSPQQVVELLEEFLTALAEEIPVKRYRRRLWRRLNSITGKLNSSKSKSFRS